MKPLFNLNKWDCFLSTSIRYKSLNSAKIKNVVLRNKETDNTHIQRNGCYSYYDYNLGKETN